MVRLALLSTVSVCVWASDEASLLQAQTGKKRLQSSVGQLFEDFARSPQNVVNRVAKMLPAEQQSLMQQFAAVDSSVLARELEPHKLSIALALRQSPKPSLSKATPQEWVSALQQQASSMDGAVSRKGKNTTTEDSVSNKEPLRTAGDNSSLGFDDTILAKDEEFNKVGGRCRDGQEFEDVEFAAVCQSLCEADDDNCKAYEVEKENEEWLCKRFTAVEQNENFAACEKACMDNDNCTGFEFEEPSECEWYEVALEESEGVADNTTNGCYKRSESMNATTNVTTLSMNRDGQRCRTGAEFPDLTEAQACEAHCASEDNCDSFDADAGVNGTAGLCKRFTATLKTYKKTTLKQCGMRCAKRLACGAFEWDDGECELHGLAVNSTLTAAEEHGDTHACYMKSA